MVNRVDYLLFRTNTIFRRLLVFVKTTIIAFIFIKIYVCILGGSFIILPKMFVRRGCDVFEKCLSIHHKLLLKVFFWFDNPEFYIDNDNETIFIIDTYCESILCQ